MALEPLAALNAALGGRYRIERQLAEGGMARVYLAEDLRHRRRVALKVLREELAAAVGSERFLTEIRTTANLQHPHILPLFDSGEAGGHLFYVMPYVKGESLRDRLNREGQLPVEEAVDLIAQISSALEHAHEQGIIHRDIKPANVMLSGGLPVLADFGIALAVEQAGDGRMTDSGAALGTPRYTSPEQATGDGPVDARSDVYSLACVLYELLTGELPHSARSAQALVAKRLTMVPTPVRTLRASVPEHVAAALRRALQPVPADRYQTAAEFRRALLEAGAVERERPDLKHPRAEPVAAAETRFVGREKERAELLDLLDAVADGRGSLVLLGGEPGVGKTRLSEYVLQEARRRDYMCVVGHAYESEAMPPFTPFIEQLEYTARVVPAETFRAVLGDAAPEIARLVPSLRRRFADIGSGIELPPDQLRHYLFNRYNEFLQRASQIMPLVVLFDDLQWADEGSLLLIEHLARQIHGIPMLAVGTYRDSGLDAGGPLPESFGRLMLRHNVHRMALRPLSRTEVEELLGALGGSPPPGSLVDAVFHKTEGNPFFVEEVFRHLKEEGSLFDAAGAWRADLRAQELDVPAGVRVVVGRRLERVSPGCRAILATAAVIGPRFALPVIAAVGDLDEESLLDALDEAEAARLITGVKGHREPIYRFTHELIRQTLIEGMSVPRRQRRHLRVADALGSTYGDRLDDHATDMAHHLYQAGAAADPGETLRFLVLAAEQALAGSAYEEALAQYDRALSLEEEVPKALLPVLLEGKVHALDGLGEWTDLIQVGRRALELYEAIGDTQGLARVAQLVCYRLDWRGRYRDAADVGRRALAALSEAPGPDRAKIWCQLGLALDLLNEPGSRELVERGLAEAEELGDESAILRAKLALTVWRYHQGDFASACDVGEEGLLMLEHAADQSTRAEFLWIRALTLPLLGRLDEAARVIHETRAVGKERNEVSAELGAAFGEITMIGMTTGDGERVATLSKRLAESFRQPGGWARAGLVWAGLGLLWSGSPEEAAALMDVDADATKEPRVWNALSGGWRFRTAAYARMPEASRLHEAVAPRIFRVGRRAYPGDGFGLHAVIEGLVVHGDTAAAAHLHEDAAASLGSGIIGHMDGLWSCTTGLSAACAERWDAAEQHFDEALRRADSLPHVMGGLDTRRWWAWMLLRRGRRGDRGRAHALLREAVAGYERIGARLFRTIALELLES